MRKTKKFSCWQRNSKAWRQDLSLRPFRASTAIRWLVYQQVNPAKGSWVWPKIRRGKVEWLLLSLEAAARWGWIIFWIRISQTFSEEAGNSPAATSRIHRRKCWILIIFKWWPRCPIKRNWTESPTRATQRAVLLACTRESRPSAGIGPKSSNWSEKNSRFSSNSSKRNWRAQEQPRARSSFTWKAASWAITLSMTRFRRCPSTGPWRKHLIRRSKSSSKRLRDFQIWWMRRSWIWIRSSRKTAFLTRYGIYLKPTQEMTMLIIRYRST